MCPDTNSMIHYSQGWLVYGGTPDYFNSCATFSWFDIPFNKVGHQSPNTGFAYAGFGTFTSEGANYREFLGIELTDTLQIGNKYYFSFNLSLSDYSNCISNNIGLRFKSYYSYYPYPNNYSHFNIDTMIVDSVNWVRISGSFIADSSYKFIEIGNFYSDVNTDTIIIGFPSTFFDLSSGYASYYYIDDICVSEDSLTCNLATEIINSNLSNNIQIYPNPASNTLYIENKLPGKDIKKIIIYNSQGIIVDIYINFNDKGINIRNYESGLYFIRFFSTDQIFTKKFMIN